MDFGIGLVPGVFLGSLMASLIGREFKLQGFHGGPSMARYLVGASLMGFGSMLAGGCAVGAGVTGGAIFALTAWVALASIWLGAISTHLAVDAWREKEMVTSANDPVNADPSKAEKPKADAGIYDTATSHSA